MSPFFNSFGKLLLSILSLRKKCTNGANKSECSVNIFTGMLPKGEALVGDNAMLVICSILCTNDNSSGFARKTNLKFVDFSTLQPSHQSSGKYMKI